MVNTVKQNAEVSVGYMKIFERERMIKHEGKIISDLIANYQLSEDEAKKFYSQI